jgi:hypothetical protein
MAVNEVEATRMRAMEMAPPAPMLLLLKNREWIEW